MNQISSVCKRSVRTVGKPGKANASSPTELLNELKKSRLEFGRKLFDAHVLIRQEFPISTPPKICFFYAAHLFFRSVHMYMFLCHFAWPWWKSFVIRVARLGPFELFSWLSRICLQEKCVGNETDERTKDNKSITMYLI